MMAYTNINPIFMSICDNRDIICCPVIIKQRKETLPMKRIGMNLLHNVFLHIFVLVLHNCVVLYNMFLHVFV